MMPCSLKQFFFLFHLKVIIKLQLHFRLSSLEAAHPTGQRFLVWYGPYHTKRLVGKVGKLYRKGQRTPSIAWNDLWCHGQISDAQFGLYTSPVLLCCDLFYILHCLLSESTHKSDPYFCTCVRIFHQQ
jgi:hypothetical protein